MRKPTWANAIGWFVFALMFSGCASTLESIGVPATTANKVQTITLDALTDGQALCHVGPVLAAVAGASVIGAPYSATPGAVQAVIASVTPEAIAALNASKRH